MTIIQIIKEDSARTPTYATDYSAGVDLYAHIKEPIAVWPYGGAVRIPTGIRLSPTERNCVGLLVPRSGLSTRRGIILANTIGVIDSDYQDEIIIMLRNISEILYHVEPDERLAQLIFVPILRVTFEEVDTFTYKTTRKGGFGSTG